MKPVLLIIGLGNPGTLYERTRHNVGFQAVEHLSEEFGEGEWQERRKFHAVVRDGRIVIAPVLLVKPQTYMNRSGEAIQKLVDYYKLDPREQIIVICDDVDLPVGEVRFRRKGGPGTHNGLKSIVDIFGEEFPRFRIGLGSCPPGTDLAAWVLSQPGEEEKKALVEAINKLPEQVQSVVLNNEKPPC